jgi:hypothetical protein
VRLAAQDHKLADEKKHDETFGLIAQVVSWESVLDPRLLAGTAS